MSTTDKMIELGPAATGKCKESGKRMFATRLSTGKRLEVMAEKPLKVTLNAVDMNMIAGLESQGFLVVADVPKAPEKASR
jgi:hypothetical protein